MQDGVNTSLHERPDVVEAVHRVLLIAFYMPHNQGKSAQQFLQELVNLFGKDLAEAVFKRERDNLRR